MSYGVVCIARVGGSVGAEVATKVAEALGFRLVDEEIVQRAAESQGIAVEELAEVEKRKGVLNRLLESLALGGAADGFMSGMPTMMPPPSVVDPKGLRALIQTSIHETADDGRAGCAMGIALALILLFGLGMAAVTILFATGSSGPRQHEDAVDLR